MPTWESEAKLLKFLDAIEEEAKVGKGDLDRRIDENIDQLRGKQWKGNKSPTFLFNIIESCLEEKAGKLSESKPQIEVLPSHNDLGAAAEVLTKVIRSIWDRNSMEYKTERLALWGALSGAAFMGTAYNPSRGDVDLVIKDPRACGIDPSITAGEDAGSGEYMFWEDFVPLDVVRNYNPGRGALVKPDARVNGFQDQQDKTVTQRIRGAYSRMWQKQDSPKVSVIPKAIIREFCIQDRRESIDDYNHIPIVDGLTNYNGKGAPFPGGRRIIRAGDVILEDTWNPYFDGLFPLDMLSWKIDPDTAWSADEVQSVRRLQEAINRSGDAYTKTILLNGVVRAVMDTGALSPTEKNKLSNEIGQIIEKNPGREFEFQVPPLLSKDVPDWAERLIGYIRLKMGVQQPPTQNRVPSIITGPAIEGLQLMIESPIRTAARRVEEFYTRIGQKLVSRVFQYYTADKLLPLIGPDNKWIKFEYERQKILTDRKGKPRSTEDIQKASNEFYFTIAPGSSLAITKTQRAMLKGQLVMMGLLHPREILLELGVQNAEEKIAEAQQAKQDGLYDIMSGSKGGGINFGGGGGSGDMAA